MAAQVAVTTSLRRSARGFRDQRAGHAHAARSAAPPRDRRPADLREHEQGLWRSCRCRARSVRRRAIVPLDAASRGTASAKTGRSISTRPMAAPRARRINTCSTTRRSFGMPTAVLRMSCIYGPPPAAAPRTRAGSRISCCAHCAGEPITIYGDGRQVRDILCVDDAVDAYVAAWRRIGACAGQAFNLGGGPANAVSLRHVIAQHRGRSLGAPVDVHFADWRPGDQRYFVSDTRRATAALGLRPALPWRRRRRARWPTGCGADAAGTSRARRRGGVHEGRARQSALAFRAQHLFRLPRAAPAARTRLRARAAGADGHHDAACWTGICAGSTRCAGSQARSRAFRARHDRASPTAPSYLFWRCAPPELRVPRALLAALGGRGGMHGRHRPARLGDAGADAAQARRRCRDPGRMRGGRSPRSPMAAPPDRRRRDRVACAMAARSCDGPTAGGALRRPAGAALARRMGARGTDHHHHRFDAAPDGPGAEVEASRGCPYSCTLLRQDRLPRQLPQARSARRCSTRSTG